MQHTLFWNTATIVALRDDMFTQQQCFNRVRNWRHLAKCTTTITLVLHRPYLIRV